MSTVLTETEIQECLADLPEWHLENGELVRRWKFSSFLEAMQFVNRVALVAESINHHPDIEIRFDRVQLALASHDVGGITRRDVRLARALA